MILTTLDLEDTAISFEKNNAKPDILGKKHYTKHAVRDWRQTDKGLTWQRATRMLSSVGQECHFLQNSICAIWAALLQEHKSTRVKSWWGKPSTTLWELLCHQRWENEPQPRRPHSPVAGIQNLPFKFRWRKFSGCWEQWNLVYEQQTATALF